MCHYDGCIKVVTLDCGVFEYEVHCDDARLGGAGCDFGGGAAEAVDAE